MSRAEQSRSRAGYWKMMKEKQIVRFGLEWESFPQPKKFFGSLVIRLNVMDENSKKYLGGWVHKALSVAT